MKPDSLTAQITVALMSLRGEFNGWWIHHAESGRWIGIRENTCIRAHDPAQLRERLRRHTADTSADFDGEPT